MANSHCTLSRARCSGRRAAQASTSHSKLAGKVATVVCDQRLKASAASGAAKGQRQRHHTLHTQHDAQHHPDVTKRRRAQGVEASDWRPRPQARLNRMVCTFCAKRALPDPPMSTNQLDKKSQAWSALFSEPMSELVKRYTSSVFFDKRLWQADIAGCLAHADMLAAQGVISGGRPRLHPDAAWRRSRAEIESGAFEWKLDLEDVHLNIEARLTQLVGDAGKRLHTGRCRNDQVATDVRLWLRGEIDLIGDAAQRAANGPGGRGRAERRRDPARLHPPAGGAARGLWPPPAGLCGDVQARCRAHGRRAPPHQRAAAGRGRTGRHHLPAGPRTRGAHPGHGGRAARTAWTP